MAVIDYDALINQYAPKTDAPAADATTPDPKSDAAPTAPPPADAAQTTPAPAAQPAPASGSGIDYDALIQQYAPDGGRAATLVAPKPEPVAAPAAAAPAVTDKSELQAHAEANQNNPQFWLDPAGFMKKKVSEIQAREEQLSQAAKDNESGVGKADYPDLKEFTPSYFSALAKAKNSNLDHLPFQAAAASTPEATVDILKAHIPGLEVRTDSKKNIMLRAPGMDNWTYLNKPGLSTQDFLEKSLPIIQAIPELLATGGESTLGRLGWNAASGLVPNLTRQISDKFEGSKQDFSAFSAAVDSGLGAIFGPGGGKMLKEGARRAGDTLFGGYTKIFRNNATPEVEAAKEVAGAAEKDKLADVSNIDTPPNGPALGTMNDITQARLAHRDAISKYGENSPQAQYAKEQVDGLVNQLGTASDMTRTKLAAPKPLLNTPKGPPEERAAELRADATDKLNEGASYGQDVRLMDTGGESTRRLVRRASNMSPAANERLKSFFKERMAGQAQRIIDFAKRVTGSTGNTAATKLALRESAKSVPGPLYRQAFADGAKDISDPMLTELAEAPVMQDAIQGALDSIKNKNAAGTLQTPETASLLSKTRQPDPGLLPRGTKTLEFWDQVKRQLDNMEDNYYSKITGHGNREKGADVTAIRNKLTKYLDSVVPTYTPARAASEAIFRAKDALEAGENVISQNMDPEEIKAAISQMDEADKGRFKEGFVSAYINRILKHNDSRDVLNVVNANPYARSQMRAVLGESQTGEIEAFSRIETMFQDTAKALGNSSSAQQFTDLLKSGAPAAATTALAALHAPLTWPALLTSALIYSGTKKAVAEGNEKLALAIVDKLMSKDPQVYMDGVKGLAKSPLIDNLRELQNTMSSYDKLGMFGRRAIAAEQAGPGQHSSKTPTATQPMKPNSILHPDGKWHPHPPGSKLAPDGEFYVPDPQRPGKYMKVIH